MGEIIQFSGLKREEVKKSSENKEEVRMYLDKSKLTEVFHILNALKNADSRSFGERTINKKRELVASYTDDELITRINNYTENDIKIHPSFYGAIIDELKFRGLY